MQGLVLNRPSPSLICCGQEISGLPSSVNPAKETAKPDRRREHIRKIDKQIIILCSAQTNPFGKEYQIHIEWINHFLLL